MLKSSALNISHGRSSITAKGEMQRAKQWCDHCNKPYHTRDTCWKLHGKPANWKPRNQRKGVQFVYMVESEKGTSTPISLNLRSIRSPPAVAESNQDAETNRKYRQQQQSGGILS